MKVKTNYTVYLFLITVISLVVKILFLFQPVRYDEAFSFLMFASRPFSVVLANYAVPNNHLFYNFLVRLFYLAFGMSVWVIRLPALIAGVLIAPLGYLLASKIYNKSSALLCAGFLASSSIITEFSTNGRGYTLIILFSLLMFYFFCRILISDKLNNWVFLILFSVAGVYTIPIMIFPLSVGTVWFLISLFDRFKGKDRKKIIFEFILSQIIIMLAVFFLYLPVILTSGISSLINNRFVTPQPFNIFVHEIPGFLRGIWRQWVRDVPSLMVIISNLILFISMILKNGIKKRHLYITISVFLGCCISLFTIRRIPPARCMLFLLPLYLTIASGSIIWFGNLLIRRIKFTLKHYLFPALVVLLTLWLNWRVIQDGSIYYSEATGTLRSAKEITLVLKNVLGDNDKVVSFCPADAILAYYFRLYNIPPKYFKWGVKSSGRVFIISKHDQDLSALLEKYHYQSCLKKAELIFDFEDAGLYLY